MLIQAGSAWNVRALPPLRPTRPSVRFFFDHARATADLKTINAGIDRYPGAPRAQTP
ncbi:hypothetical protein M8494_36250 [Serratia ureilytica]